MESVGKTIILLGGILVLAGVLLAYGPKIPLLGKLPGDILIKKEGFSFYFPLATSLLLSALLSLVLYFLRK